jgi:signal transduction histidine kinase
MVFLYGGLIGLGASIAIGFWLAGRTLTPIRHALESQRRFVSDASHELRTPLAVAKANSALILDDPEGNIESHLDQAEAIATELDHLTVLVGDLTTLARADEGRANLLLEPLDLGELTAEVVRDMGALADVLGVNLTAETGPAPITGDRARLRQLLMILVDNSLKYAHQGGAVHVRSCIEGHRAELSVSDDGDGIAPADQKRIFERFYRADGERTRSKGGTGLGLAIGKWITEAHGGRITVESHPGKGTTFHVRLPLAPDRR